MEILWVAIDVAERCDHPMSSVMPCPEFIQKLELMIGREASKDSGGMRNRDIGYAFLAACAFTFIPLGISSISSNQNLDFGMKLKIAMFGPLMAPGFLVAAIVSGNAHNYDYWIVIVTNLLFYFGLACLLLRYRRKRKARM